MKQANPVVGEVRKANTRDGKPLGIVETEKNDKTLMMIVATAMVRLLLFFLKGSFRSGIPP